MLPSDFDPPGVPPAGGVAHAGWSRAAQFEKRFLSGRSVGHCRGVLAVGIVVSAIGAWLAIAVDALAWLVSVAGLYGVVASALALAAHRRRRPRTP